MFRLLLVSCNLAAFQYETTPENQNCFHLHCPTLESCILTHRGNVVLYNITKGNSLNFPTRIYCLCVVFFFFNYRPLSYKGLLAFKFTQLGSLVTPMNTLYGEKIVSFNLRNSLFVTTYSTFYV